MFKHRNYTGFIRDSKTVITAFCVSLLLSGCGQQQQSNELIGDFSLDVPIAYVKRPVDAINNINPLGDPRNPFHFTPGGNLYFRAVASSDSPEINLTDTLTAVDLGINKDTPGDVADPSVSYDGTKIVFAMKIGEFMGRMPNEQPTWNIWEYDTTTDTLTRVIPGDIKAEEGNDTAPVYLPDGRIAFLSDRQVRSKQFLTEYGYSTDSYLDEDRRNPAAVLHVMNSDGSNIQQISFNQSDDIDPTVLTNGKIVFSRWEHAAGRNQVDIFQVNPDGTDLNILYGAYSHATADGSNAAFISPREMPDGRLIANVMPRSAAFDRGDMVYIDYKNFIDINTPMLVNTSAQSQGQVSVTGGKVPVTSGLSHYGRYANPFPLWDGTNRILVSWTPCLAQLDNGDPTVVNPNPVVPCPADTTGYVEAEPLYHVVIVDLTNNTQKPIVAPETGMAILQPVALVDRSLSLPASIPDKSVAAGDLDADMVADEVGAIDVRSVYDTTSFTGIGMQAARLFNNEKLPCNTTDFSCTDADTALLSKIADPNYVTMPFSATDTTVPRRPARFVRIVTAVPTPPMIPRFAYGRANLEMRAIAGYAPVEPDGSVYTEVPADVPFAVEVLDDQGRKFAAHNDWMQVRPGETLKCNGCHSPSDGSTSINSGADTSGSPSFLNSVVVDSGVAVNDAGTNTFIPQAGDTMAEAKIRLSCYNDSGFCGARKLSSDIEYTDLWTTPPATTPEISIKYRDPMEGLSTPYPILNGGSFSAPAIASCIGDSTTPALWTRSCRIVINYEQNIQPMWDLPRPQFTDAAKTIPLLDSTGAQVDYQCTSCHSDTATDGVTAQIPAGARQLDLTAADATTAIQNPDDNWYTSYQELLLDKFEREIDAMGALVVAQDCSLQDTDNDPTTPPVLVCTNRALSTGSPIVIQSARRSYLIEKLTETELGASRSLTSPPTVDHSKMMTAAEIRLLSEWIDMGAPYYSNPYVVP